MAYPVAANSILEVTLIGTLAGQTTLTILHYKLGSTGISDGESAITAANAAINNALPSSLVAYYLACCGESFALDSIRYQWIYTVRYLARTVPSAFDQGTVAGACMPPGVSVAITKQSQLAGRHGRGTVHMPGVPLTFVTAGLLDGSAQAPYTNLANELEAPIPVGGGTFAAPVIYQRASPINSQQVIQTTVQQNVRTMSRRVVGRGI